jgi:hypothetical protein
MYIGAWYMLFCFRRLRHIRKKIIKATKTSPPTAAPAIAASGRDLELVELGCDNDVADGW